LVVAGLLLAGLLGWLAVGGAVSGGGKTTAARNGPAPISVTTTKVAVRDFPVVVTALGAAQAWQSVLIQAQVNGKLLSVPVQEGSNVKKGQLLAEIDPAPYQAALLQAQGALHRDEAALEQARNDLKRYQTLATQNSIAGQQVDTQAALVKQDEGTVMLDKGAVAVAQVNLGYTRIVSPADGRVGVRLIDAGNLVSTTGTTGIISVNTVTPIAVTFTIPEGDFQRLATASDGFKRPLSVQALSQETSAPLGEGQVVIADNHVDSSSGTVQMKARFPNADSRLWPGQFVNVRLTVQTLAHALTVPSVAVNQGPNGPFVFVVKDDKASVRPVSVITTQDSTAVIKTGLTEGDVVVTDGQLSLKQGSKVRMRAAGRGPRSAS
jgi:multidrug efflux system membrane fusion protein